MVVAEGGDGALTFTESGTWRNEGGAEFPWSGLEIPPLPPGTRAYVWSGPL